MKKTGQRKVCRKKESSPSDVLSLSINDEAILRRSNHQAVGDGSTCDGRRVREGKLVDVRVVVVLLHLGESEISKLVSEGGREGNVNVKRRQTEIGNERRNGRGTYLLRAMGGKGVVML